MENTSSSSVETINSVNQRYRHPSGFLYVLGALFGLECLVGIVCNVTVLVIHHLNTVGSSAIGSGSRMAFLVNLSVVDLSISAVTIPMTIARVAMDLSVTPMFCVFHEASVSLATTASALALILVSLNRYATIVRPFRSQVSKHNAPYLLAVMWALAGFGFAFPVVALMPRPSGSTAADRNGTTFRNESDLDSCFLWVRRDRGRIFYELYYVVVYAVANLVMLTCYVNIYRTAKRRINTRMSLIRAAVVNVSGFPEMSIGTQKRHERRVTRMTLLIVMTFFFCWAPHAWISAAMLATEVHFVELVHLVSLALAYSTTVLHPMLYAFMRDDFRRLFNRKLQAPLGGAGGAGGGGGGDPAAGRASGSQKASRMDALQKTPATSIP